MTGKDRDPCVCDTRIRLRGYLHINACACISITNNKGKRVPFNFGPLIFRHDVKPGEIFGPRGEGHGMYTRQTTEGKTRRAMTSAKDRARAHLAAYSCVSFVDREDPENFRKS
jgi:hypothetical protein